MCWRRCEHERTHLRLVRTGVRTVRFRARITWTQWYVGLWWWPVREDLALGVNLGPLSLTWSRR